jgi:predicted negative regulator of RcsB-dependent stress response
VDHVISEVFVAGHLTRKELKSDQVAVTVEQTFDYVQAHQKPIVRAAVAIVALAVIIGGVVFYRSQQHGVREARLGEAVRVAQAPVGAAATPDALSFATNEAKAAEENKVFGKLLADYPGTYEGYIAEYYLGGVAASQSKMDEARKRYQDVIDHGDKNTASLAKFALAQIALQESKPDEAEKILRDLMDHPTDMVSKEQATLTLAESMKTSKPAEARKLLEPLAKDTSPSNGPIAGEAARIMNDIPK